MQINSEGAREIEHDDSQSIPGSGLLLDAPPICQDVLLRPIDIAAASIAMTQQQKVVSREVIGLPGKPGGEG